jgi:hypothetical protein
MLLALKLFNDVILTVDLVYARDNELADIQTPEYKFNVSYVQLCFSFVAGGPVVQPGQ